MGLEVFENTIWYLDILVVAALIVRLMQNGLSRTYRRLFLYLSIDLVQSLLAALLQSDPYAYGVVYFVFRTLKMIVAVFLILEVYRLALADQPALAAYGRKAVAGVLVAAGLVASLGLAMDYSASPSRYPILKGFRVIERTMDGWMALFLILISCFIAWFPVRMKRNVALYIGGFVAWSLAHSSMLLFINLVPAEARHPFSIVILLVEFLCLLVWLVGLRPEGEELITVTGHLWNPGAMERLTSQLGSINASLERLGRR
jgi:hypothetical protein